MGAYEHLNNLGYVLEEIDLDSLKLENPYKHKEGRIFFIIRKEDLNPEIHKKVIEEETWFMKEAIKDKWEESEKKGHNVGLYCGVIGWLEKKFGKNGTEEEYKKMNKDYIESNGQLSDNKTCQNKALAYSLIIKENGDTYFVLRKSNSNETLFSNCIQLIEMAKKEKPLEWIEKNAENFRKALEDSLVHGKEEDECYTSYRNLEEKIEESIK